LYACVVVTRSPPGTGTTRMILSTVVPVVIPAAVVLYTQVLPTATGKSSVPVKEPPAGVLAAALPALAEGRDGEADGGGGDEDEDGPQPARASAETASSRAPLAAVREVELWRFMRTPFAALR
jgi:hypothetical protein